jgi:hypothetical protein
MTVANDNAERPAIPDKQLLFDLPRESYDSLKSELNWSRLKELGRSAAHFKYALENPSEPTDHQARGIAGHVATLEPKTYGGEVYDALSIASPRGRYAVWPTANGKRGTKAWDAAEAECKRYGTQLIREVDHEWCVAIAAAVQASSPAAPYLRGRTEVTMRWKEHAGGMGGRAPFTWNLRGRVDKMSVAGEKPFALTDLKSTVDSSEDGFMKQVALYGYHAQGAFYLDGYKAITGVELAYAFIAVEAEPPHVVTVFEFPFDDEIFQVGREIYRAHLELFRRCTENNDWPGYAKGVVRGAQLPKWARPFEDDEVAALEETAGGTTPLIGF